MGRHDDDGDKMTASGEGAGVMCHYHVIKKEKFFSDESYPGCGCRVAVFVSSCSGRCKS